MAISYTKVDQSANQSYQATADLSLPFDPNEWVFEADDGNTIDGFVSFDGKNDHLHISKPQAASTIVPIFFKTKSKSVWLRSAAGAQTFKIHVTGKTDV